jgi:hypothetical protein
MKTKSISMSNGKGDKPRPVEIDIDFVFIGIYFLPFCIYNDLVVILRVLWPMMYSIVNH